MIHLKLHPVYCPTFLYHNFPCEYLFQFVPVKLSSKLCVFKETKRIEVVAIILCVVILHLKLVFKTAMIAFCWKNEGISTGYLPQTNPCPCNKCSVGRNNVITVSSGKVCDADYVTVVARCCNCWDGGDNKGGSSGIRTD